MKSSGPGGQGWAGAGCGGDVGLRRGWRSRWRRGRSRSRSTRGTNGIVLSVTDKQEPSAEDVAKNFDTTKDAMLNDKREEVFRLYLGNLMQRYQKAGAIRMSKAAGAAGFGSGRAGAASGSSLRDRAGMVPSCPRWRGGLYFWGNGCKTGFALRVIWHQSFRTENRCSASVPQVCCFM